MEAERRKTLETLLEFALNDDPRTCWDPSRAMTLLRHQSSVAELEQLGVSADLIAELWPESRER